MNAADCSTNNNPLLQFNKRSQQSSITGSFRPAPQQSNLNQTQTPHEQFKSSQNILSERSKHELDNFYNQQKWPSLGYRVSPAPILHQSTTTTQPSIAATPTTLATSNESLKWSKEFQSQTSDSKLRTQPQFLASNATPSEIHALPIIPQGNLLLRNNSAFVTPSLTDQQPVSTTNWDEQFGTVERELAQNRENSSFHVDDEQEIQKEGEAADEAMGSADDDTQVKANDNYQSMFQRIWDELNNDIDDVLPSDETKYFAGRVSGNLTYEFSKEKNLYFDVPDPYKVGCILLEKGARLSEAALAFEAAVQKNPGNVDAWLKLGVVQAQNEKELNSISALERCLKLDPQNLEAMKNLAISYINEGYVMSALGILNTWIETKYPDIGMSLKLEGFSMEHDTASIGGEDPIDIRGKILRKFQALKEQVTSSDPDIELSMGLLYYSRDDFSSASRHFREALRENPTDYLMWNRLGASLANSGKPEEAIKAYQKAIQLRPSLVRARYNLAVACMSIGCYKEAAENLLATLSMQETEGHIKSGPSDDSSSTAILETLKRALIIMDKSDLSEKVRPGMDLDQFRGEFTF